MIPQKTIQTIIFPLFREFLPLSLKRKRGMILVKQRGIATGNCYTEKEVCVNVYIDYINIVCEEVKKVE